MRVYFLSVLFATIYASAFSISRCDTLLNQLTIEEKVAMLFLKTPNAQKSDSTILGHPQLDLLTVRDIRKGFSDTITLSYPNEETFRTISDKRRVSDLLNNALAIAFNAGYDGIITYDKLPNVSRLYVGHDAVEQQRFVRVVDFPCELLDELLLMPGNNASSETFSATQPMFTMWNQKPLKPVCFNDLLEREILFWEDANVNCQGEMVQAVYEGKIEQRKLDERVCKLLNNGIVGDERVELGVNREEQLNKRYEAYKHSISIYQKEPVFPVVRVDTLSISINTKDEDFISLAKYYQPQVSQNDSAAFVQLFLCDNIIQLKDELSKLKNQQSNNSRFNTLVYIGAFDNSTYREAAKLFDAIVVMPQSMSESSRLLAEAIYGGIAVDGISPIHDELIQAGFKQVSASKIRLAFNSLTRGFNTDSVAKIDSIVNDAIRKKAAPGAQLMVVKGGDVILQKSYGHHTYSRKQRVSNEDIYDVASVTKLAVTFPLVMQLYEEGQLDLDASLREYLPEVDTTDKADITIRELLLHQSGLISYIPFHYKALDRESLRKRSLYSRHSSWLYNIRVDTRLYQNKNARYRKDVFAKTKSEGFNRQVTAGMFMNDAYVDSMYAHIYNSPLRSYKDYRYSDLGYYLLQRIIEKEENESLDSIYYSRISHLLGADKLLYNPLNTFAPKHIVPTEKDLGFRKRLLDGYVHDQGAAMMGGVAAHAGLFANAGDLAKLGQMLLNEGKYGGIQFVDPRTVGLFTKTENHGNRRGLGVDKPELDPEKDSPVSHKVSQTSYGHTGFTGTVLWIDPEHEIIYIFLSNRIHPHSYNRKLIEMSVRTKIQDVIYNTLN